MTKEWIVTLDEDESGNLILPIPAEIITAQGWEDGTELDIQIDSLTGEIILMRKNDDNGKTPPY